VIYVGIDDTDVVGTAGTNQLARAILRQLGTEAAAAIVCRHQLLFDPSIPFTSKNGSASIQLPSLSAADIPRLVGSIRGVMRAWFIPGSDPGLCVTAAVPAGVQDFARSCQHEVVTNRHARAVASDAAVYLEGLGGSEQGIIGALAAVGLIATGDDGRVVHLAGWPWPDAFGGTQPVEDVRARGVHSIRRADTGEPVTRGAIDVGKHLRPNIRGGQIVLFVEPASNPAGPPWRAVKLP
jgi:hypothetical protein